MKGINAARFHRGPVLPFIAGLLAFAVAATATLAARSDGTSQPSTQRDSELAAALVQQAWPKVAELLPSDASLTPTQQFIQAHALTALNQPNEAVCTLLAVSSDENIAAWHAWAKDFQASHPQHAVAYYLLGDALARTGDRAGAIAAFTAGLQLEPANPLLLNARGTTYAIEGNRQAARQDFLQATSGDRPLVDARVGAGSLIIDRRGGASDARTWFDSALTDPRPENALALYGRALTWVAEGDWERANSDLEAALASAPCIAPLMATQLGALHEYMAGASLNEQDAASGFALTSVIEPFLSSPTQQNASRLLAYLAAYPQEVQTATTILRATAQAHPLWATTASQQLNQANTWNASLQPTFERLSALPVGAWQPNPYVNAAPARMVYASSLQNRYPFENAYGLQSAYPSSVYPPQSVYPLQSAAPLASLQLVNQLRESVGPQVTGVTPGGFDASLHAASFDRGDWPAVTYYGLLYPASAAPGSSQG